MLKRIAVVGYNHGGILELRDIWGGKGVSIYIVLNTWGSQLYILVAI